MEQWEYLTTLLEADAEAQREYLSARYPNARFKLYHPIALVPQLNEYGEKGWELVSVQPVAPGTNWDILIQGKTGMAGQVFARHYLCAFKRRKQPQGA